LVFTDHDDNAGSIRIVQEAFNGRDPSSTWIARESLGYTVNDEQDYNDLNQGERAEYAALAQAVEDAIRHGRTPAIDSFGYALCRAAADEYGIFFADLDLYEMGDWHMSHAVGFEEESAYFYHEVLEDVIDLGAMPFTDAAANYFQFLYHSVYMPPEESEDESLPLLESGDMQLYRGRVAVNRVVREALALATAIESGELELPDQKATILHFMGGAHQRDVEQNYRTLDVRYNTIAHGERPHGYATPGELDAVDLHEFGKLYIGYWLESNGVYQDQLASLPLVDVYAVYGYVQRLHEVHHLLRSIKIGKNLSRRVSFTICKRIEYVESFSGMCGDRWMRLAS